MRRLGLASLLIFVVMGCADDKPSGPEPGLPPNTPPPASGAPSKNAKAAKPSDLASPKMID